MKRINLLPKSKQVELGFERVLYSVVVAVVVAILILLMAVVVQVGVYVYLDRKVSTVNEEIDQLKKLANKSENAEVKQQIRLVNAQIDDFTKLSEQTPQWAELLAALTKDIPESVKITQFDADTEKKEVSITGYSPTRDLVIELYNNINSDKVHFKNINYPLENVSQPTDVRFFFKFLVADNALIKSSNETK